jgi:hypothetical protein
MRSVGSHPEDDKRNNFDFKDEGRPDTAKGSTPGKNN